MAGLIKLLHLYVAMTDEEAAQRMASPDATLLEKMIYGQINKAGEGDARPFQFLIEVMCGKIPEADKEDEESPRTPEQKLQMMKDAVKLLELQVNPKENPQNEDAS